MSLYEIFIQVIGYIGLVCAIVAFQCKKHKHVMLFRTLNELLFAIQYFLLGSYTGCAMNITGSIRNEGFAYCIEKKKSTLSLQIIFSLLFIIMGILTYQGYISIFIIAAKVVTTFAYGLKNTKHIRFLTLPTSACWLIYNIYCNSQAGILTEIFTIISILTAIVRIDMLGSKKLKNA